MQRRRYLALLAVTFAGCNSASDGGDTPAADGTGTPTATRGTATRTSAPTTTDPPTETTEQPTETTEQPTETTEQPTETATPEPDTADHIADAREALSRAYDAYLEQDGGDDSSARSLRYVESGSGFDAGPVRRRTTQADAALDRAAASGPSRSEESLVERLRDVGTALERLAVAQAAAADGYESVDRAFETIFADEDAGAARRQLRDADSSADRISTAVNSLRTNVRPGDFETVSFMDGSEYREKRDQFDALEAALENDLPDRLSELGAGFRAFGDGVDAYSKENYAAASGYLDDAVEQFNVVRSEWDVLDAPGALGDLVEIFGNRLATVVEGTEDLSTAATEFQNGSGAVEQLMAKQTYREDDTVAEMPTVQRILDL
jgi:hypothetical protein